MSAVNGDFTNRYIREQIIFVLNNIIIVNKINNKYTLTLYNNKILKMAKKRIQIEVFDIY